MRTFQLRKNQAGALVYARPDLGIAFEEVQAVRAFPVSAPGHGIALQDRNGKELEWISDLSLLEEPARALLLEALAQREFMPEIRRLHRVSSLNTPSVWEVETDRGMTSLTLQGEEHLRRIGNNALLISTAEGVWFLVRDMQALDDYSRRMLDRFL